METTLKELIKTDFKKENWYISTKQGLKRIRKIYPQTWYVDVERVRYFSQTGFCCTPLTKAFTK